MRPSLRSTIVVAVAAVAILAGVWMLTPSRWRIEARQTVLSTGLSPADLGDGGPAEDLLLCHPNGLEVRPSGELLVADPGEGRRGRVIWRIGRDGMAHLVAGSGLSGSATEDLASELRLNRPESLAAASDGSLLLLDGYNHSIFRIDPDGRVKRVAGNGTPGFSGDGGQASQAQLFRPADIRLDSSGNLYISEVRNHRIRQVDPSGRITTIAGTGEQGFSPDGTPARSARIDTPWALEVDLRDRVLIAESANHIVRRIEDDGTLVTIAGSGVRGFSGDGGPATEARLNHPEGLFVDKRGRLFIADSFNHVVRVVDTDGTISTVVGTGNPGKGPIGGVALLTALNDPEDVVVDSEGLVVSDGNNGRVIRVSVDGTVQLVAGRGETWPCASPW